MRKINYLFAFILMAFVSSAASAQAFQQGKTIISVGYGFGNLNRALFKTYESQGGYNYKGFGPIAGKFEYAVSDKIGIGLSVNHINADVKYNSSSNTETDQIAWNNTSVLGRLNIHFSKSEKFDIFWGAGLGYRFGKWKFTYADNSNNIDESIPNVLPFGFETTFGVRYFFIENLGVYSEIGIAKAPLQFGLSAKF